MEEKGEKTDRQASHSRWLYACLGVLLASSLGLAIALGVTLVGKDDSDDGSAVRIPTAGATANPNADASQGLCITPPCVLRAGELLEAMDRTADPCKDFYQYSCGNWLKTHSIPESESSYSRFTELQDKVKIQLKDLLEKPYDRSTDSNSIRKAKNMYKSCLDEDKLNTLGARPLTELVHHLGTWPLTSPGAFNASLDLESLMAELALVQLSPLIDISVNQDDHNSSQYIAWIDQIVLSMDRSYMLKGRNSTEVVTFEELRRQQAIQILGLSPSPGLDQAIGEVVEFEIQLAQMSASVTERRDTDKYYRKKTIAQLSTSVPQFNWMKFLSKYFGAANITVTQDMTVAVFAEDYLNSMLSLYQSTDKRIVANYLLTRIVGGYAGYLSKDLRELSNPLRKVLYGVTQSRARWKSCVDNLDRYYMPTVMGQLYVRTYFSAHAKNKALEMIAYIRQAIKQIISETHWMDDATKAKALEKADAIIDNIGYPDYQFNETVLEYFYKDVDYQPDSYFQNVLDFYRSDVISNSQRLNRTPSRKDWSDSASTVNAYYSPSNNAITFPAGILQPPFYSEDFPMSMMFGGIGLVIGHEITHGFDDQGRKYDKEGNNQIWWPQSSVDSYQKLSSCYVDQYSQQEIVGLHVNGNLTLGENIADNGGLKASFMAFKRWQSLNGKQPLLPGLGLSHEQLFFVNFAQGWCTLMTEEGIRDQMLTNEHSPASVRVIVPPSNSEEFAKAFSCPVGSAMNPVKRCSLW